MSPVPVSLAELTARHRDGIVGYLVRLLGDRQEAEDACQDAFLRAHRAFAHLGPEANSPAWLYRIATRSGLNAARRRSRRTARAVGAANGANPIAIVVPCHRVIASDGRLSGYAGGVHRKRWLLEHERAGTGDQKNLPL